MVVKNVFLKGLDKDTNHNIVSNEKYVDAHNMTLTGDGNFWELANIESSKLLIDRDFLNDTNIQILSSQNAICLFKEGFNGLLEDTYNPVVVIFVRGDVYSYVILYNIETNETYTPYQTFNENGGFPLNGVIDSVVNTENNVDVVYFVDNENVPRRLELSFDFKSTLFTWDKLSLIKFAPINKIDIVSVEVGGNLLAGSYSFAYRYFHTTKNIYSKFSTFTNEIPIYHTGNNYFNTQITGDLPGVICDKKIKIKIDKTNNEIRALYNAVQLVVKKRIDGTKTNPTQYYLTSAKLEYFYDEFITYTGSEIEDTIASELVVVDEAPIKTAKTIEIKDNRIFLGNVKYFDRKLSDIQIGYVNQQKEIVSGEKTDSLYETGYNNDTGYKSSMNCYNKLGYFRGEVYRFGIVAMDKYGNWSNVQPIDFSQFPNAKEEDPLFNSYIVTTGTNPFTQQENGFITTTYDGDIPFLTNAIGNLMKIESDAGVFYREIASVVYISLIDKTVIQLIGGPISVSGNVTRKFCKSNVLNQSEGVDFKFIGRDSINAPLRNENNQIEALYLKLGDITNFPDWAVAIQVVRMERIKNIIDQTIHVPCYYVIPADTLGAPNSTEQVKPKDGANPIGTLMPKRLSQTPCRNICIYTGGSNGLYKYWNKYYKQCFIPDSGLFERHKPTSYSACFPSTWLYNYNGEPYSDELLKPNNFIYEQIDAATFIVGDPSGFFLEEGQTFDNKSMINVSYLHVLHTIDYQSYWFKQGVNGDFRFSEKIDVFFDSNKPKILGVLPILENGLSSTLIYFSNAIGNHFESVVSYLDLNATALENGNPNGYRYNPERHLLLMLNEKIGDLTYLCQKHTESTVGLGNFPGDKDGFLLTNNKLIFAVSDSDDSYNISQDPSGKDNFKQVEPYGASNYPTEGGEVAQGLVVYNITKGLSDDRYGNINEKTIYKQTGYYKAINSVDEVISVANIFGGDCFVGVQRVKMQNKSPYLWQSSADQNELVVDIPKLDSQHISYFVESEINTSLHCDKNILASSNPEKSNAMVGKSPYDYSYNFAYTPLNSAKEYYSFTEFEIQLFNNNFPSRIAYSNLKIGNDKNSLSTFPVLNVYDVDSSFGAITKIIKLNNNNVYCLQEYGVSVLPINKSVLETGDGASIVVNSGAIINTPQYLMTENGCQHIRSVCNSEDSIFFVDVTKRQVLKIGEQNSIISDVGMYSHFKYLFNDEIYGKTQEKDLIGVYDFNKKEYLLCINGVFSSQMVSWSDKVKAWVSILGPDGTEKVLGLCFAHKSLFAFGQQSETNTASFSVFEMYQGINNESNKYGAILWSPNASSFSFVVNLEHTKGKIFDTISFIANNRLAEVLSITFKENGAVGFSSRTLDIIPRHDCYVAPILRDVSTKSRMRGKYMLVVGVIDDYQKSVRTSAVETTIRFENRITK